MFAACQTQRSVTSKNSKSSDPIMQRYASNYSYTNDEHGNMRVQSDRRSAFEGKNFSANRSAAWSGSNRDFNKQFAKQQFAGNKEFAKQSWQNDSAAAVDSQQRISSLQGRSSRMQGHNNMADKQYATKDLAKQQFDSGKSSVEKTSSDYIRRQSEAMQQPEIMSSEQYRQRSIDETRAIMGRKLQN